MPHEGNPALSHSPHSLSQRLVTSATSSIPDPIPLPRGTVGQEVPVMHCDSAVIAECSVLSLFSPVLAEILDRLLLNWSE